jgi:hypothetical protein
MRSDGPCRGGGCISWALALAADTKNIAAPASAILIERFIISYLLPARWRQLNARI